MSGPEQTPAANVSAFSAGKGGSHLAVGGGGPHDPNVEMRLSRLEDMLARIEKLVTSIDDRLRKVEIELAELNGRVSQLPSTWAMITTMLGGQIAFAAAMVATLRLTGAH